MLAGLEVSFDDWPKTPSFSRRPSGRNAMDWNEYRLGDEEEEFEDEDDDSDEDDEEEDDDEEEEETEEGWSVHPSGSRPH